MKFSLAEIDSSWHSIFREHISSIDLILDSIDLVNTAPSRSEIFRAFHYPLSDVKVVIFGQDPYPGKGVADGLAFSSHGKKIPASLRNIFKELSSDIGIHVPETPDLTRWMENGILLLNRTLTTTTGESNAHSKKGWKLVTNSLAEALGERDIPAILWGANARELAKYFRYKVESVHPSPLSAHNGFFGSGPFSNINAILNELGREPIDWTL
jgi:uracil-DNA glycosylase